MSEEAVREEGQGAQRSRGLLVRILPGVLCAMYLAVGITFVDAVIAKYSGSYLPWSVAGIAGVFWMLAAGCAAAVLSAVLMPLCAAYGKKRLEFVVPALVLAAGYAVAGLVVRETLADKDALARAVLLATWFICAFGAAAGAGAVIVAAKGRGEPWKVCVLYGTAITFCSGAAYFIRDEYAALMLVAGPPALFAVEAAVLDRLKSARSRTAALAVAVVLSSAGLLVMARSLGESALEPVDGHFRIDPAKTAMLAGKPNVLIIVLDTVRADHTSLCGYEYPTTPNLEKLAKDCRFFPYGESVDSWTLPAHASLFTGKYPREHGAHADASPSVTSIEKYRPYAIPLAPSQLTLATYLSMKGYNTAGIVANYSWLCRQYGLNQGFAYYHDIPRMLSFAPGGTPVVRHGMDTVDRILGRNGKLLQTYWSARDVTGMAEKWLTRRPDAPFFLFLNYMDPHYPYSAPPPFDKTHGEDIPYNMLLRQRPFQDFISMYINTGRGLSAQLVKEMCNQYDGEIAYTDYYIGRLVEYLKREGLYDDMLLIVTSDHGEFFGEHQLLNHGVGLYEGGLRIPILVKYPGRAHAGEVIEHRVSIIDIFATVFDVLALPTPECSGVPLGGSERAIYAEDFENGMNVKRYGEKFKGDRTATYHVDWKYILSELQAAELYDLAEDPQEMTNLVEKSREVAGQLRSDIVQWQQNTTMFDGTSETSGTVSQEEIDKLKALGYLGGN